MQNISQLLSGFFESIETSASITNAEGEIVLVNPAYCSLSGYTREELLGQNFTITLPPEQREEALQLYKTQFAEPSKEGASGYQLVQKKDGRKITVALKSFNILTDEGTCYRVSIVREVSQLLNKMNRKEFFTCVLNNVEDSVVVIDLTGSIVYWNKRSSTLFQLKEDELIGEPIAKYWPEHNIDELLDFFREGNKQFDVENWHYHRQDGTELYINLKVTPLLEEQGLLSGLIFLSQDVTEKHKNELDLLQQRNMLASLIESQSNFLIRLSPKGNIEYTNKAFTSCDIFSESMQGNLFEDFIHPEDRTIWRKQFHQLLQSKSMQKAEFRLLKKEGAAFWTKWEFVRLLDFKGELATIQGVGLDISERKKAERERDDLLSYTQALNEELQASEEELRQNLERTIELNHFVQKSKQRFQSLLENSFEAIMLFDEAGFITYTSSSIENTLGYGPEEMLGKKGMAYVHEEDKNNTRALLAQAMEEPGRKVYIQQRVRKKSGSYIWVEAYTTNLLHDENVRGIVSNFRDVTERIKAEEKLRDSEASLNLAQHIARLGSAEFDLVSGKVDHSSGVFAIYDYDLSAHSEKEFNGFSYIHPDDVEKVQLLFSNYEKPGPDWVKALKQTPDETLKEVESGSFEYRIISAKGRLKYLKTKSRFIRNKEGELVKSILTIQDVSEEKHRERLLGETSRIARIGGWELNPENKQIFWTQETYELFEIPSSEELNIEKATAFYLPEYQPILKEAFQALITNGTPFDLELKMATAAQKGLWVRMVAQAETVNGKVVLAKGTMQDISKKKEAEQAISKYAERLRLATEAGGIGIWDWDLQEDIMVWDQQMRVLYDIPKEKEVIGHNDFKKAVHPEDMPGIEALHEEALKSKNFESEFRIIRPSTEIRWIKSYAKVIDDEKGEPKRMIGVNWDISRLKQTEEVLRFNNEELLKTNDELDHFVYSTSHNLRAPLTSILGIVNLIKGAPEKANYPLYIDLIEKSVMKLDETIQEIADYSRNTRVEVELQEVNFEALIQEIVEGLSFLEQAERIRISYVVPDNSRFLSDNSRLKMIFTNLISNAIKYSDAKQEEPFIFIQVEQKETGISIKIKDNGIGIAPQHQDRIFNMFFRASSKSTGSGLGLYIVREAVLKLGGTIEVSSQSGVGTEFTLFLPEQEKENRYGNPSLPE